MNNIFSKIIEFILNVFAILLISRRKKTLQVFGYILSAVILIISCLNNCEYGIAMVGCFFLVISLLIVLHSLTIVQITA